MKQNPATKWITEECEPGHQRYRLGRKIRRLWRRNDVGVMVRTGYCIGRKPGETCYTVYQENDGSYYALTTYKYLGGAKAYAQQKLADKGGEGHG